MITFLYCGILSNPDTFISYHFILHTHYYSTFGHFLSSFKGVGGYQPCKNVSKLNFIERCCGLLNLFIFSSKDMFTCFRKYGFFYCPRKWFSTITSKCVMSKIYHREKTHTHKKKETEKGHRNRFVFFLLKYVEWECFRPLMNFVIRST